MNRNELENRQAPLKAKYEQKAESAVITLKASGSASQDGLSCSVETGRAVAEAGLHPMTGGSGLQLCSGDMLLQSLVACAGVTLGAVASAMNIRLIDANLQATAELDVRGTLGMDRSVPVGLQNVQLAFAINSDCTDEMLEKLVQKTERYCVVLQTLQNGGTVTLRVRRTAS